MTLIAPKPVRPCRHCGKATAPLGEFCPASDPDDLDFHDFGSATYVPGGVGG